MLYGRCYRRIFMQSAACKRPAIQPVFDDFLELRGIEPLSEISSAALSPTTVFEILFPLHGSPKTDFRAG